MNGELFGDSLGGDTTVTGGFGPNFLGGEATDTGVIGSGMGPSLAAEFLGGELVGGISGVLGAGETCGMFLEGVSTGTGETGIETGDSITGSFL